MKIAGFVGSMFWFWFYCNIFLDIICTLKIMFEHELNLIVLGFFSFFIWFPVYLTTLKMSRIFGFLPSLAGVVFNSTIAIGLSTLIQTLLYGPQAISLFPFNTSVDAFNLSVYYIVTVLVILGHLIHLTLNNQKYHHYFGVGLVVVYFSLLAYATLGSIFNF